LLLAANKSSTNANASPFVVAINVAGIKVLPHIINAAAVIFVLSAANSDVYVNSRTAYSLAMVRCDLPGAR
jgi:amino acid transporter